jgi:hypothetical protein
MWSQGKARHTSGEASLPMPASDGAQTAQPQGLDGFGIVPLGQSMTPHSMGGHVVPPAPPAPPEAFPPVFAPPAPPTLAPAPPPVPVAPPDETVPPCPPGAASPNPWDLSVLSLQPTPTSPARAKKPKAETAKATPLEPACTMFFMSHPAVWAANPVPKHALAQASCSIGPSDVASAHTLRILASTRRGWAELVVRAGGVGGRYATFRYCPSSPTNLSNLAMAACTGAGVDMSTPATFSDCNGYRDPPERRNAK